MTTPFWSNEPSVLLNKDYIFELWPTQKMTNEEKLNAISRLVILLSILGFLFTMSYKLLIVGLLTLVVIFFLYNNRKQKLLKGMLSSKEGMIGMEKFNGFNVASPSRHTILNPATLDTYLKSDFQETTKKNPLSNVLLTQIVDEPDRLPAPPSFNTEVYENINNSTKKMVQMLNPTIKSTNKQLFGDLGEKFEFDQSQWSFYSTPNTKVCNDQGSFSQYLYGDMISAKEGNQFALLRDNPRYLLI